MGCLVTPSPHCSPAPPPQPSKKRPQIRGEVVGVQGAGSVEGMGPSQPVTFWVFSWGSLSQSSHSSPPHPFPKTWWESESVPSKSCKFLMEESRGHQAGFRAQSSNIFLFWDSVSLFVKQRDDFKGPFQFKDKIL